MSYSFTKIEGHEALTSSMAFALFDLDQKFFPTPWSSESWSQLFSGHERSLMTLAAHHEIIGFVLFDLSHADSFAHLLKILVHPEFREKGLARQLLEKSLLGLKNEGLHHFFLEVEEDNHAAQKLYQSCGFKVIHRKKDFYGNVRAALIMTADL